MSFFERLELRARKIDSLICVGLDPHPEDLASLTPEAVRVFCLRLIEATADLAVAFKPNSAFFEAYGPEGISVLKQVIKAVPEDIPVILDAKRADIASTAEAYAHSAFDVLGAHAVTVNPYLGYDAIEPFLGNPDKAVFLLCKTSNPGAADLQDLSIAGKEYGSTVHYLYERVAILGQKWNTRDNLGLVVGANQPESLARVRALVPDLWILAPGIGRQGGDLSIALHAGLRTDGFGLLIPVSRAISRADNPRKAVSQLNDEINRYRSIEKEKKIVSSQTTHSFTTLADELLKTGCVKFGQYILKSGLVSPIYIDLRRIISNPHLLFQVAEAYLPLLNQLSFDRLVALPYAALPIATAICLQGGWPMLYPRKEVKSYGTRAEIEGEFHPGERVVVIDDLTSTGGSKFEAIEKLITAGLQVSDVVVLIDRQSGASEALSDVGIRLHSVFTLSQLLDHWEQTQKVTPEQITSVRNFLKNES